MDNAQIGNKNTENIQRISGMTKLFPGSICTPYHSSKYYSMHRETHTEHQLSKENKILGNLIWFLPKWDKNYVDLNRMLIN